jgi:RNA polymerase sigma factor (sigma-70 family)
MPDPLNTHADPRHQRTAAILARLIEKDHEAFVRLALSRLRRPSREDAEDAVQAAAAAFLAAYDPRRDCEHNARAYFCVAVKSHAFKINRTRSRKPAEAVGGDEELAVLGASTRDFHDDELSAALARVGERPRKALGMQLLGFERSEIAAALGVSDRGLRKLIGRGRSELRAYLEEGRP